MKIKKVIKLGDGGCVTDQKGIGRGCEGVREDIG